MYTFTTPVRLLTLQAHDIFRKLALTLLSSAGNLISQTTNVQKERWAIYDCDRNLYCVLYDVYPTLTYLKLIIVTSSNSPYYWNTQHTWYWAPNTQVVSDFKFNLVLTLLYVYVRYATEAIQLHMHHITLSTALSHMHKLQVKRNKIYVCMYV